MRTYCVVISLNLIHIKVYTQNQQPTYLYIYIYEFIKRHNSKIKYKQCSSCTKMKAVLLHAYAYTKSAEQYTSLFTKSAKGKFRQFLNSSRAGFFPRLLQN